MRKNIKKINLNKQKKDFKTLIFSNSKKIGVI